MSSVEAENGQPVDQRSSVKLVRNAKGDTQIEVKVRARGDSEDYVLEAAATAEKIYDDLRGKYTMDALRPRS